MKSRVEYLPDTLVDAAIDQNIRSLLTVCFTGPDDAVFKERRYFREPYQHRWVIRNEQNMIIAHTGVHQKHVESNGTIYHIGGMAEVCVHPEFRGQGFVNIMLNSAHKWLIRHSFDFAVLFGNIKIYKSSGYVQADNLWMDPDPPDPSKPRQRTTALIRELFDTQWPTNEVYLPGPKF